MTEAQWRDKVEKRMMAGRRRTKRLARRIEGVERRRRLKEKERTA